MQHISLLYPLGQIAIAPLLTWVIGTIISLIVILTFIWNITSYIRSRASKDYVNAELKKKVDKSEFDEHRLMFEQFRIRHEQHNSEIQRLFYKKVDDMDSKWDKKFDGLKSEIIQILKDK